jgi:hypothetical protein
MVRDLNLKFVVLAKKIVKLTLGRWCKGILVGEQRLLVNITLFNTGPDSNSQAIASRDAILSGNFDFFLGPFSSVRRSMLVFVPRYNPSNIFVRSLGLVH